MILTMNKKASILIQTNLEGYSKNSFNLNHNKTSQ